METNLEAKPLRRPWTARELVFVAAIVVLCGALVWEHVARVAGERDARDASSHQSDLAAKWNDSHELADQKWKLDADKKIDQLKSRVIDLENVNRERGGR
jgi:uncharacterized protein YceH (UPF0502 family)